ncbi:MAG: shikimate kinase [Christensenella sp.]|nr:shikimate kinase [Christensenella sp.]
MVKNVYLTGMMGSGKTEVGRRAAALSGRRFVDIDEYIEKKASQKISDIFQERGELYFRRIETEALKEIGAVENGAVVSCGGGIILSDENIAYMRGTGVIVYVERPIALIEKTSGIQEGRPVLQGGISIGEVFAQRRERYESAGQFKICNDGTPESAAMQLAGLIQSI